MEDRYLRDSRSCVIPQVSCVIPQVFSLIKSAHFVVHAPKRRVLKAQIVRGMCAVRSVRSINFIGFDVLQMVGDVVDGQIKDWQ